MEKILFNNDEMSQLLNGVRDPIRMDIVLLLAQKKILKVGDIAICFKVSRPAISHHLKVLKDAGIVQCEKIGQEIYYHLDRNRIVAGLRCIADEIENCCTQCMQKES